MMTQALGIPSHYEQWGEGEDILLLHGWGKAVTLERHLAPLAQRLKGGARVTALEFPAHGQSGKPAEVWGVPEYARWTQEMISQLGLGPVTVVAHSFGARVALWLAVHQPQLVRRMVLTGAAGLKGKATKAQQARAARYQALKRCLTALGRLPGLGGLAQRMGRHLRDKHSSADYLEADEDMKQTFVCIVSQDLDPLLPQVRQPTLLVWGDQDQATPLWMGQRMAQQIPDAALVVFEGRGHFAYAEEIDRFAAIVRAMMTEDSKTRV